ncbi:hypothetical protein BVG16_07745 [Paenibacillus selenitireducens]|uniref:Carrier domain-containing protein n=1 Tax=Paenibacillus selenitireducens TaxID=1324314 RepID=A0A1T2XL41_9BACL|nr:non-ribosomal peptide synthetase [Paenibacillus selenitireducens]OPA80600.1 hypothetical protein BVG16_07745 [Paenibacillus selenitireducens]
MNFLIGDFDSNIISETKKADISVQRDYWVNEFSGEVPVMDMPTDYLRPKERRFCGAKTALGTGRELREKIKKHAEETGTTEYMIFLSGAMILLSKYSRQEDIVIGSPISARTHKDTEGMQGIFVNTLAMRGAPEGSKTYEAFLEEIKEKCLRAYENQEYPFDELVESLKVTRDMSRNPLFDVMLTLQNNEKAKYHLNGIKVDYIDTEVEISKFDLEFNIYDVDNRYGITLSYCTDLYKKETADLMLSHYKVILEQIVENRYKQIKEIEVITEEERSKILGEFNDTQIEYSKDKTVIDLFEEQVKKTPDNISVVYNNEKLTYSELNKKANQVARKLREFGVKPDDFVAVIAERSLEMIIGIYGILKAGGAYVPIDPDYPEERIKYMLEDCSPKVIMTVRVVKSFNSNTPVINIGDQQVYNNKDDENLQIINKPSDLAYCIYTSGTTGIPKGVLIGHGNLVNYCSNNKKNVMRIGFESGYKKIVSVTNYSFDIFGTEIWLALLNGMTVYIASTDSLRDDKYFSQLIKNNNIEILQTTPSLIRSLLSNEWRECYESLKLILLGGEKVDQTIAESIYKMTNASLINVYGPTETTIWSTCFLTEKAIKKNIPIGKPISNTTIYILNDKKLCGVGMRGELCIAGEGVSRGYLNRPELTAEKFVENPYGEGMMYRTGDLGRWLPDGNIEYLGRMDEQVKIRGLRIELGEIESTLRKIEYVKDCAVIAREDKNGEKSIYAYVVSEQEISVSEVRDKLSKSLPSYMIPSYMGQIEQIPVTSNGKLDKRALPELEANTGKEYEAPRNETENMLCEIYQEILNVDKVGINDGFFELGGHSLRAIRVINRIEAKTGIRLGIKDIFITPTVKGLSEKIAKQVKHKYESIPEAEIKEFYPMSSTQKRIYFVCQMDDAGVAYNMPRVMRVTGEVCPEGIKAAMQEMLNRHEILRTEFLMKDGEPVQRIREEVRADFKYIEDSETSEVDIIKDFIKPFDLSEAPLFRAELVKRDDHYLFMQDTHHIVSDGMSNEIYTKEFHTLYSGGKLEPLMHQYKDYSEWMLRRDLSAQMEYWVNEFSGEVPVLDMPTDYRRPQERSFSGATTTARTGKELGEEIKRLARETGTTEYMIFIAAAMVLLNKYSRQEDIIIGSLIGARTHKDTESMLGMFVNTLAMRGTPKGNKAFQEFLGEIKDKCLKAYETQEYPFEELVDSVDVTRDMSRNPLFDVLLVLQNNEKANYGFKGIDAEYCELINTEAKFDLTFDIYDVNGDFEIELEYCTSLYREDTAIRMTQHLIEILKQVTDNREIRLLEIEAITEEERVKMLGEFNDTHIEYPRDKTVVELFEEQVEKKPDKVAISFNSNELTFRELSEKANQLARVLIGKGVGKEVIVGLMTTHSLESVLGILGVLKAGGAYLPIDSDYPAARINYMLEDAGCNILLTNCTIHEGISFKGDIINLDLPSLYIGNKTNIEAINKPNNLAYVIYTSGSTGMSKGVMIEHQGLVNYIWWAKQMYVKDENEVFPLYSSLAFDLTVTSIFTPLISGNKIVVYRDNEDEYVLYRIMKDNKATVIKLTPSHLSLLKDIENGQSTIKRFIVGGEDLKVNLAKLIYESFGGRIEIYNEYGPTETVVGSMIHKYDFENDLRASVPIGLPAHNVQIYILDTNLNPVPEGIIGEMYISGDGVARGYMNRLDLTQERFIANPFIEGKRMYKTSDLARRLQDGNIEFLGRIDEQVKLRGYRIELGEVENAIKRIEGLKDCVVIVSADQNGDKTICAYIVSDDVISVSEIRGTLGDLLPEYMIPAKIMQIESIPITKNGKINKNALPEIMSMKEREIIAPKNEPEEVVIRVFRDVLGIEQVGVKDNFFELGGDSIKAIRIASKMREAGYEVSVKDIMNKHSAEAISQIAKQAKKNKYEQGEVFGEVKETPILASFRENKYKVPWHYNQEAMFKIDSDNSEIVCEILNAIVEHHDILRSVYRNDILEILRCSDSRKYGFEYLDLSSEENEYKQIDEECTRIQSSFDLANGPLIKAALIKSTKGNFMFICIHHLVIDEVSWRILIEDFNTAYRQIIKGENIKLPQKTASYKEWSETLEEYSQSEILNKEKVYWNNVVDKLTEGFLIGLEKNTETRFDIGKICISLTEEETENLVKKSGKAYNTEINDLLLCALGMAVMKLTGQETLTVGLEGHGREEIHKKIDVDRTVGWFTSIYPVIITTRENIEETIIETKEMLRRVPNRGVGYGLMKKFLGDIVADIYFNYLGETDAENKRIEDDYSIGKSIADENYEDYININGEIVNQKLSFAFTYKKCMYNDETVGKLAGFLKDSIKEVINFCTNKGIGHQTLADVIVDRNDLNNDDLDILNSLFN